MKRKWLIFLEVIVVLVLIAGITYTYTRTDKRLRKYSGHKNFDIVKGTLAGDLLAVRNVPDNHSAYYSLGQGFYGLQGYDDAIWALKEATRIAPDIYYYWAFLGKVYQAQKDYPLARDAYIKTLELEPNKPMHYTVLAWLYYFRLEPEKDKAFEVLKKGLERFPDDKDILFDITRYYLYDQNEKEFLKYAPRYIKIDPDNKPINDAFKK